MVENDFEVLDSFLTGSYRRSTMIAPLKEADVDVFVVLDAKYYTPNGQAQLLQSVQKNLLKTYTKTPRIRPAGRAVTIRFTDFKVDVVPSFNRQGGGYLIPDADTATWIPTNPKRHVELWAASNKAHNGDFVPLIKILKGWNKSRDLFKSFHLETIIYTVLNGIRIDDYPSGVRYVFDKAQGKIKFKLADPAGYSDDVGAHVRTEAEMSKLIERLAWAHQTAAQAEQLAANGHIKDAFEKWKLIFKDYFPAYG